MTHHALSRTVAVVAVTAALLLSAGPAATATPSATPSVTHSAAALATTHPAGLGDLIGGLPCRLFGIC